MYYNRCKEELSLQGDYMEDINMTLRKDYGHGLFLKIVVTDVYFQDGDTYFTGNIIEHNDKVWYGIKQYTIVMDENVIVVEV